MKGNAYSQNLVWPSGIRIGTDLSRAGISLVSPARDQIEINADIDLYKYFLTVDYGYWDTDLSADDRHYSMNGSYFRAGFDYNFLFYDEDRHVMFFGFRYGRTGFDEAYEFNIQDPIYGTGLIRGEKTGSSAGWMEVCTGMKIRIAGQLYLGWTGRLKFGLDMDAPGEFTTYEIPGYGKTAKTTSWGLNYSIYYRIVFRNKPPIPRKSAK
jgi:hypothetical protein